MAEPITCVIGGETVTLTPILTLGELKRIEDPIDALMMALKNGRYVSADLARVRIVSVALVKTRPDLTAVEIENRLRVTVRDGVNERAKLSEAVDALLDASGLFPEPSKEEAQKGEGEPAHQPA